MSLRDRTKLETASRVPLSTTAVRHLSPKCDPRSGEGARPYGDRCNPPDSFPALYVGETRPWALAELARLGTRQVVGVGGPVTIGATHNLELAGSHPAPPTRNRPFWGRFPFPIETLTAHHVLAERVRQRRLSPAGPRLGEPDLAVEELAVRVDDRDERDRGAEETAGEPRCAIERLLRRAVQEPGMGQCGEPLGVVERTSGSGGGSIMRVHVDLQMVATPVVVFPVGRIGGD